MTESGVTFDPAQLVMDDEWIAMIRFFQQGIRVDRGTLLVDDIARVGPFGDFLSLDSTFERMREQSAPRLMDRRVHEEWEAGGGEDMYTRAAAEARRLIEEHRREPLDDEVRKSMAAVVAAADREHGLRSSV